MRDGLDPAGALDRGGGDERAHPSARARVVVQVDEADAAGVLQRARDLDQAHHVGAERRVELRGDDPLPGPQRLLELRLALLFAERDDELALLEVERRPRRPVLVDRGADGGDLRRRRATAAADDAGPEVARMGGELREVVGRRVREDDATPGQAREADVGQRRERQAVGLELLQRGESGEEARAVVRADRGHVQAGEALGGVARGHARQRLRALVEGEQRDDGQARDRPDGLDRVHELVEVVERLDHEQVGASALEHGGLVGEELAALVGGERVAERADRAGDEDLAPGHLARVAGELHGGRVDPLELVLEEVVRELAAVCAEGVRLDELRARVDEADVERDDRVGRAEVRLFGAAQARHRARDERAHPAVGDDRRAAPEALQEPVRHAATVLPASAGPVKRRSQAQNG